MEATQAKKDFVVKKQFNHSLSVRIVGLLLSFFIGTQPLMAAAQKIPVPVAAQEQTLNPLFMRFAYKTLAPYLIDLGKKQAAPKAIKYALMGYLAKPERRTNFLDLRVEENSHFLEILSNTKKYVTQSGFVRTAYESLIINNVADLQQKQNFIHAINPSEIDGALSQISLTEEKALELIWADEEIALPIDAQLFPLDAKLLHSLAQDSSSSYKGMWKKLKLLALRYPLITFSAFYAMPALTLWKDGRGIYDITKENKETGNVDPSLTITEQIEKAKNNGNLKTAWALSRKLQAGNELKNSREALLSPSIWLDYGINWLSRRLKGSPTDGDSIRADQMNIARYMPHAVAIGFSFYSLWGTLKMFKSYQNGLVNLSKSLRASHGVYLYLKKNDLLKYLTADEQAAFENIFDPVKQHDNVKRLFYVLATGTFKEEMKSVIPVSYNVGRIGSATTLLNEAKQDIQQLFVALGHVDYISGLKKLITDSEEQKNGAQEPLKFSFVEFVDSPTPIVTLKNTWFPLYGTNAVPTDVSLGAHAQPHHLLITGVNGTGKSGVMLSTLTCITMGMSHGIAPAEHARMTPFANIHAHMNVGDDQRDGKSGYTNEMKHISQMMARIQKNNDANKERTKPEFFFVLQDETFRSTDKDNAYQLGWGLMNFLNNDKYTLSICASHVYELSAIEKATNGNVRNAYIHSDVIDGQDGYQIPVHSRKLKFGVNQVRGMAIPIALDALKKEGLLTPQIKALFATKPPKAAATA